MPTFIDMRIRVRKEKMGDLAVDMPKYAQIMGFDVVGMNTHTPTYDQQPAANGTVPRAVKGSVQTAVEQVLSNHPKGVSLAIIRTETGLTHQQSYNTVGRLVAAKKAKKLGDLVFSTGK